MDQLKEILQQAIKYRFWIVVGIACLLPMIGYAMTAGTLDKQTKDETQKIEGAYKGAQEYTSGKVPNTPYKEAVEAKTAEESGHVVGAWRKLYDRQKDLLTWPEAVADRIPKWGQKWPEGVVPRVVNEAVEDYVRTYPDFVQTIYESFHPWDPEDGKGIVVAPPKEELLRPQVFDPNKPPLPTLGKVWAAQQKLWAQGAVLDVIARLNDQAGAKNWEQAPVKQINALDVASPSAMDQRSLAAGTQPKPAPDIDDPNKPKEEEATADAGGGGGGGQMEAMMKGMGGMGMSGGAAQGPSDEVYFLEIGDGTQYKVVPIYLSVMLDQARIPDLLVAMQNSPMGIQVLDIEFLKESRVQKPKVGEQLQFGMGGMGYPGMGGMMGGRVMGGGMSSYMRGGMGRGGMGMMSGYPGGMGGGYPGGSGGRGQMEEMMKRGGMGAMMGGMGAAYDTAPKRKGIAVTKNLEKKSKKKEKDEEKKAEEDYEPKLSDPYFSVVELRIYGQARFYLPPPEDTPTESPGATAEGDAEKAEATDAAKAGEGTDEPKAKAKAEAEEGDADAKKDDAGAAKKEGADEPKGEAAKDDADAKPEKEKAEPKGDADAKGEDQGKDEADAPKGEAPKR